MTADYWGLKLYHRYYKRNAESFEVKSIISVIFFFHCLTQVATGFTVTKMIILFSAGVNNTIRQRMNIYGLAGLLIIIVFISALVIFPSTIILLKAIKKNRLNITDEIDNIGTDVSV